MSDTNVKDSDTIELEQNVNEDFDPQREFSECCRYFEEEEAIRIFQSFDVDPCKHDEYMSTPLHAICANGMTKLLKIVLEKPGIDLNVRSEGGNTPLHYATLVRQNDIIKLLLEHGADYKAENDIGKTPHSEAVSNFLNENMSNNKDKDKESKTLEAMDMLIGPDDSIPEPLPVDQEDLKEMEEDTH